MGTMMTSQCMEWEWGTILSNKPKVQLIQKLIEAKLCHLSQLWPRAHNIPNNHRVYRPLNIYRFQN